MTPQRYEELNSNGDLKLTPEEVAAGWIRCLCEWDGLLIRAGDPEATCCSCLDDNEPADGRVGTLESGCGG